MMAAKRPVATAVGAGVLVAVAGFVAHQADVLDDLLRAVRGAPDRPPALPHVPEGLPEAVKDGVSTFRAMRNGTDDEKVMVQAACAVFGQAASGTRRYDTIEDEIENHVPPDVPSFVVDRYVGKLATAMYAAEQHGGLARWYIQYCS